MQKTVERKLKYLLNSFNTPSCVVHSNRKIAYVNREFVKLIKAESSETIIGSKLSECVKLKLPNGHKNLLSQVITEKKRIKKDKVLAQSCTGDELLLRVSVIPLVSIFDEDNFALFIFADLTPEKKALDKYGVLYERERDEKKKLEEFNLRLNELIAERTKELSKAHADLKKAYTALNEELEIAKNVQEGLIPNELPDIINIDACAIYIPTGKVGGDLYDIIFTPRQKVAVLIFDVAGHGVPASLIAAMAKMLFCQFVEKGESPALVFDHVNKYVSRLIKTGHYLTAFLGIIDPISHSMVYANAGHSRPIVYRERDNSLMQLEARGSFIGHASLADIAEYSDEKVQLETDDKLVLYTDGLTEAININDEMYGPKRLNSAIEKYGKQNIQKFVNSLLGDLKTFRKSRPLTDDFTILALQLGDPEAILKESGFCRDDRPQILVLHTLDKIESVCAKILEDMDNNGYSGRYIRRTKLCIHEILTNAIIHGNNNEPGKKVVVLFKVTTEKVIVSAVDEGAGFDYNSLPNPLDPENLLKENGRGLFIVRKFTDEISFNKKGNRISIVKYQGELDGY